MFLFKSFRRVILILMSVFENLSHFSKMLTLILIDFAHCSAWTFGVFFPSALFIFSFPLVSFYRIPLKNETIELITKLIFQSVHCYIKCKINLTSPDTAPEGRCLPCSPLATPLLLNALQKLNLIREEKIPKMIIRKFHVGIYGDLQLKKY